MANVTISKFSDGTNTGYIASQAYFECSTGAFTAAKVATSPDSIAFSDTSLIRGVTVQVKFTNINDASSPTLKVGTSTAKPIKGSTNWPAGSVVSFTYDGTNWVQSDEINFGGYLTFSSSEPFTLATANAAKNWDGTLEYSSINRSAWSVWDGTTTLSSGNGNKLYIRGTRNTKITSNFNRQWVLTGSNISCTGNIENLLDYQMVARGEHPTMANSCYFCLFQDCTSLTTAPELPATTLIDFCYYSMFSGCTNLISAPELPATVLATSCYNSMFRNCTSLTTAPALPNTTLKQSCYANMFRDCTSLTSAPALPATTLVDSCYTHMFANCTSLVAVPILPATTLTDSCYFNMFKDCSSIKLSTTQTGEYQIQYKIPLNGTGTAGTDSLTNMFTNTGGTFTGTPSINTTYYLSTSNSIVYPDTYIEYTPNKVTSIDSNSTDL